MKELIDEVRRYTICQPYLKGGVNPILSADIHSKVVIIGLSFA